MPRQFSRMDDGMIKDDLGRWIPPVGDNKDYIDAIIKQSSGDVVINDVIDVPVKAQPKVDADLIKTLIIDLKKAVSVDPKLDAFLLDAIAASADEVKP